MLAALHEASHLQSSCPELHGLIDKQLATSPQKSHPTTKLDASRVAGSFFLLEFTSDGLSKRTPVSF